MTDEIKPSPSQLDATRRRLSDCLAEALEKYFEDLDGQEASALYELIICEVERPLFEILLARYKGNISKTARALGLNRGTLRSRLRKYNLSR